LSLPAENPTLDKRRKNDSNWRARFKLLHSTARKQNPPLLKYSQLLKLLGNGQKLSLSLSLSLSRSQTKFSWIPCFPKLETQQVLTPSSSSHMNQAPATIGNRAGEKRLVCSPFSQHPEKRETEALQAAKPLIRKSRTTAAEPQYQSSSQRAQTFFPCPFVSFLLLQTPLQSQNTTAQLLSWQRERQHTNEKPKHTHTHTQTQMRSRCRK
jgi:hypothetical protein